MLSVVFEGHSLLRVVDAPEPKAAQGEALLLVNYTGVCGSDLTLYAGKNPRAKLPVIPGHEFSGTVVEISGGSGDAAPRRGVEASARVAVLPTVTCGVCDLCKSGHAHLCRSLRFLGIQMNGSMTKLVAAPVANLYPVPPTVSDEQAALTEPIAVAVHAVRRARIQVGDPVLVVGAGPIGLLVALVSRMSGCRRVLITEVARERIAIAEGFGFETLRVEPGESVLDLARRLEGFEPEVLFECTGHPSATAQMIELARFTGQVVIVGAFKEAAPVDLFRLSRKELSVTGSFAYGAEDFARALALLGDEPSLFGKLITHVLPLDRAQEAMDLMIGGKCVKVLLKSPQ